MVPWCACYLQNCYSKVNYIYYLFCVPNNDVLMVIPLMCRSIDYHAYIMIWCLLLFYFEGLAVLTIYYTRFPRKIQQLQGSVETKIRRNSASGQSTAWYHKYRRSDLFQTIRRKKPYPSFIYGKHFPFHKPARIPDVLHLLEYAGLAD